MLRAVDSAAIAFDMPETPMPVDFGLKKFDHDIVKALVTYVATINPHNRLQRDDHIDDMMQLFFKCGDDGRTRAGWMVSGLHLMRDRIEDEARYGYETQLETLDTLFDMAGIPPRKGFNIYKGSAPRLVL